MALRGIKVIELAGLAPAPFCGMILCDFGASVIRVDRPNAIINSDKLSRGKRSIMLDLQQKDGIKIFERLCTNADVLLEPFRKGVLHMIGKKNKKPHHPVNLLGDFAGGGMLCALGICLALIERNSSEKGQVIDANMTEGSSYLSSWIWKTQEPSYNLPIWGRPPGENLLDGGAHFYQTYKTKDGKFMAVGAIEPQFYKELLKGLDLSENDYSQYDDWEKCTKKFTDIFETKTQEEWCKIFDNKDACVTPVLTMKDAPFHPHNAARKSFMTFDGQNYFPRPAPVLHRSPAVVAKQEPLPGEHTKNILVETGYNEEDIICFLKNGVVQSNITNSKL